MLFHAVLEFGSPVQAMWQLPPSLKTSPGPGNVGIASALATDAHRATKNATEALLEIITVGEREKARAQSFLVKENESQKTPEKELNPELIQDFKSIVLAYVQLQIDHAERAEKLWLGVLNKMEEEG